MKKGRQQAAWALIPLLIWMLIGSAFAPRPARVLAASLGTHLSCVCRMCKGGAKFCCCTPTTSDILSSACDASDEDGVGFATAPSLLPPIVENGLPSVVHSANAAIPVRTNAVPSRVPIPLLTPPKQLS